MYKRRRSNGKIIVGCFILLLSGFLYGFFSNGGEEQNKPNNNEIAQLPSIPIEENKNNEMDKPDNEVEDEEDDVSPVLQNDDIVTNNTKLIFKTYYEKTRDTLIKEKDVPTMMVGTSLEDFESYLEKNYYGWNIREINKDFVELYQVSNQISPNHYVVKEHNGYLAVFYVNEEGDTELFKETEISISFLSNVDQQKLREGIIVKGEEGVNQILEDYSS